MRETKLGSCSRIADLDNVESMVWHAGSLTFAGLAITLNHHLIPPQTSPAPTSRRTLSSRTYPSVEKQ
jgi:hypothetical protein